jgi:SAM-dependent methyltransferase
VDVAVHDRRHDDQRSQPAEVGPDRPYPRSDGPGTFGDPPLESSASFAAYSVGPTRSSNQPCPALSGVEFHRNSLNPPLRFAEDDSFDLAFASSVFTHIPLRGQAAWIDEIHRILRPGGFFACTVLGRAQREIMFDQDAHEQFGADQQFTMTSDDPRASLSTQVIGSWDVFQTHAEVLRCFGRRFEVLDYLPGFQDLLVLRKALPATPTENEYRPSANATGVTAGTLWL